MYAHPLSATVHCIVPGLAVAVCRPTRPTTPDTIFTPDDMSGVWTKEARGLADGWDGNRLGPSVENLPPRSSCLHPDLPMASDGRSRGGKGQELLSQRHVVERAVQGARGAAQPATQRRACAKKSDGRRWPRFQDGIRNAWEPSFLAEGFPHGRRRLADAGGSRMFCRRWDPCVEPLGRILCFESTTGARSHGSIQS